MIGDQELEFRQKCRLRAIEIARDMKPAPNYNTLQQAIPVPSYNLLKEAESIFQWLVSDSIKQDKP